jgi:hypothetical protein
LKRAEAIASALFFGATKWCCFETIVSFLGKANSTKEK